MQPRAYFRKVLTAALVLALTSAGIAPAQETNSAKARALVNTAINMTDSAQAVKLLWQAIQIDPGFPDAYLYLGLYYNSRSDFANVLKVYKQLIQYQPNNSTAYLNIGEAYMSFSPPKINHALPYYRKAYQLDPRSAFAALRIGEILAQQPGNRDEAIKYLKQASAGAANSPDAAAEAQKVLRQMGAS